MWILKRTFDDSSVAVEFCRRTTKGQFILQLTPDQDAEEIIGEHEINGIEVEITMPDSMNVVKRIIHHPELAYMNQEEVADMLAEAGAVAAVKPPDAAYAFVSWKRSTGAIPTTVLVGWDRVKVKNLQPRPRRCYCCQTYGHIAEDCTKTPVCPHCGQDHEPADDGGCNNVPHCAACGGPHAATDPECPTWKQEKTVMKIRREKKLSYSEAVRQLTKKNQEEQKKEEQTTQDKKKKEEEYKKKEEEQKKNEEEQKKQEEEQKKEEKQKKEDNQGAKNKKQKTVDLQQEQPMEADEDEDLPEVDVKDYDKTTFYAYQGYVWEIIPGGKGSRKIGRSITRRRRY